jgi:hypothetical protein
MEASHRQKNTAENKLQQQAHQWTPAPSAKTKRLDDTSEQHITLLWRDRLVKQACFLPVEPQARSPRGSEVTSLHAFEALVQGVATVSPMFHAVMIGYAAGSLAVIFGVLITHGLLPFYGILGAMHSLWILCSSREAMVAVMSQ